MDNSNETVQQQRERINKEAEKMTKKIALYSVVGVFATILALMFGIPTYKVWQQGLAGKAALERAIQDRQIKIEEAKALNESAGFLAKAEITRAEGVKEANKIISDGLGGPEGYLRYLYINGLMENKQNKHVIYLPTEAGVPILEAGKR